jgi:hypothetical protein
MDKNMSGYAIFLCPQGGVVRISFFKNAKCKKGKKMQKRSFSILDDQYQGEKVDVVRVQHYFDFR